ncbi:FtsX-like permease family protein [Clostridium sp.]|uniref:FtsX-like permease family protein n=1 Tax=Clostridium sp. TaxID=1506 RepID=UPI002639B412|nr:FtsX-like permease family protein [Clostridium sp.]
MKTYKKSIIREILSSKARFFSVIIIIFLGVAFYSGIKSASPDMNKTINTFYENQNLMDSKIVSTMGLLDKDLDLLKNNDKILDYYGTHTIDANLSNISNVVRFMEYDKKNNLNKLIVLEGKLPEKSGEIALDERAFKLNKNLKIGDEFVIDTDEDTMKNFKESKFKIVGMVKSPLYIEKEGRGVTKVGKGTIDYFGVLNSEDINMEPYTEIYVRFKNTQGFNAYGDEYKGLMEENNKYLENLYSKRAVERGEEVRAEVKNKFNSAYEELNSNEQLILHKEKELENGKKELEVGKSQYLQSKAEYDKKIKEGNEKFLLGEKKIEEGQAELNKQKVAFEEGQNQIDKAKESIDKVREEFLNQGINPDESTYELQNKIEGLKNLSETMKPLSNDIKTTVKSLSENEEISSHKIQTWKEIISKLGLSELNKEISELESDPKNKELALSISNSLEEKGKSINENYSSLEFLLVGITKYQEGKEKYEKNLKVFNSGKSKLEQGESELANKKEELAKGKKAFEEGKVTGEKELSKAKAKLDESEKSIAYGEKSIVENKKKLKDGKKEIEEKEKSTLDDLGKSKYIIFNRTDNPGYSGYKDSIDSLNSIASVLPVFFFLVAILICLTTMTRMVEEKRTEIGTMKALGYDNFRISLKFVVYALLGSLVGCIFGILVGSNIIPNIISNAYTSVYEIPKLETYYYKSYIIQSLVISILCTVGAALFVIRVELKNKPSNLMRPKAPKSGKKILLERISPLWKRLNFNQKVTFRNLFRYKQRMFMTIFGIAGSMALLLTGFGLKDSNNKMVQKQFNKIWKYEAMVVFGDNSSKEDIKKYKETLKSLPAYENNLEIHQESVTLSKKGMNKQTVTLYVPENKEILNQFIVLNDRISGEKYNIPKEGVIINEKLAKLLGVSIGDNIIFKDEEENPHEVKVENIGENYIMHSIYMSPSYYEKVFGKKPVYNTDLLNFNKEKMNEDEITSKLMECKNVINVAMTSKIQKTTEESAANMNVVMIVIILSAGALAFVVLYNLNNINISERIRELSTIKVLGFFDDEVTMYILRENIILTLLGIGVGGIIGRMLHTFIIRTSETDTMMMYPNISLSSYVISALITIFFSVVVMILMHIKLRKVNMIDALKSNE